MSERFRVVAVTGYSIYPERSSPSGNTRLGPSQSYSVLDSAFCYQVVAEFNTGGMSFHGSIENEQKARNRCRELNEWDALHGTKPVPEFAG